MSVAGVPVQLMNRVFDFALVWAVKGFWKNYKPTFSFAQLIGALHDNEQRWLSSNQRNYNVTTYRATLQISLQHLIEHAGIVVHRNIIPNLYELVDYAAFQSFERSLVTSLYPQLIEIQFDEQIDLPYMSERSYQLWLFKQFEQQSLNYKVIFDTHEKEQHAPCLKIQLLTEPQLNYLVRKAIRYNLVQPPPSSHGKA